MTNKLEHLSDEELVQYYKLFQQGSKRTEDKKTKGMDSKFLYHVVRLLSEVEQIMSEGDLDLQEKGRREHMKAIRRGEIPEKEIRQWAADKEKQLEKLYNESSLPYSPAVKPIKDLLLHCIEDHYGSLEECVEQVGWSEDALKEIDGVLDKHRRKLYS